MSGNKHLRRRIAARSCRPRGTALVEFAIGLLVFLLIVFAIMELALLYFAWNRVSEAARDGSRQLIVSSPLADLSGQLCSASAPAVVSVDCGDGGCATLLPALQAHAPFVTADQVAVQYGCSGAGNPAVPDANRVRSVTLTIQNVPHPPVIAGLAALGWGGVATLPPVSVTRTSEDLHTPTP